MSALNVCVNATNFTIASLGVAGNAQNSTKDPPLATTSVLIINVVGGASLVTGHNNEL